MLLFFRDPVAYQGIRDSNWLFTPRHDFFSLSAGALTRGEFQRFRMGGLPRKT